MSRFGVLRNVSSRNGAVAYVVNLSVFGSVNCGDALQCEGTGVGTSPEE